MLKIKISPWWFTINANREYNLKTKSLKVDTESNYIVDMVTENM